MKFRLTKGKGSVQRYTDAQGVTHYPGDVVDLPESMLGEAWLEPVKQTTKPIAPVSKVEPAPTEAAAPETKPGVPLEPGKAKKSKKND